MSVCNKTEVETSRHQKEQECSGAISVIILISLGICLGIYLGFYAITSLYDGTY